MALLAGLRAEVLPEDRGAAAVWQALRKCETNGRVLYLTAHPDDEDAALLTYLARGKGYDVTLLSLTRGESGANLITGDTFDRLGVLRTLELAKAAQYYGVRLRFANFADYGYSKSIDEAWRKWNREEVVGEVVRVIREVRPQVMITRFSGTARDGHGQHQASGVVGPLAFEAAGNLQRYDASFGAAWQPSKIYQGATLDTATVMIDAGVYEPLLGRSYAQMGREGYRWQRSQAMGAVLARPGPSWAYLRLAASRVGMAAKETDLFERIDVAVPAAVRDAVQAARNAFTLADPSRAAGMLVNAWPVAADASLAERLRRAFVAALGVELEALVQPDVRPTGLMAQFRPWTTFAVATPGQTFRLGAAAHVRSGEKVDGLRIRVMAPTGWKVEEEPDQEFRITAPPDAGPTQVSWERDSIQETKYRIVRGGASVAVRAEFRYRGVPLWIEAVPETSSIDAIGLQVRRSLAVGPAISVRFGAASGIVPAGRRDYRVECVVRNVGKGARRGELRLDLPRELTATPATHGFAFQQEGEEARFVFDLHLPERAAEYRLAAVAKADGLEYRTSFEPISYQGLDTLYVAQAARHLLRAVDVKVAPGIRVGYVMGSGDDVPETLRQLGVPVDLLSAADVATADLSRYQTLLLGIRAYATRPELKVHNARLLDYVKRGGVLVVQYNTQEYDGNYGPYPYSMTVRAEEISEEDAPVTILEPNAAVFREPNAITARDFDGWVEQRGSKFWMTWAPEYRALLESHDTGQAPQKGGWLEARHGDGLYVYCAYAWYRQLPYAVPGAVRLFANLVSLGAPSASWRKSGR